MIEEVIRNDLADAVSSSNVSALCVSDDYRLCAVAAYRMDQQEPICHSQLLGVQIGYYRRGYGLALKQAVIEAARDAGAAAVLSTVHVDNDPMIELNIKLGANVEKIPGDRDHRRCVIPVL